MRAKIVWLDGGRPGPKISWAKALARYILGPGGVVDRAFKFASEALPAGRIPWAPLHPFTAQDKIASGRYPDADQTRSGKLKRDLQHPAQISETRTTVEFAVPESQNVYAGAHENGMRIAVTPKMRGFLHHKGLHLNRRTRSVVIPKRPAYGMTDRDCESIADAMAMQILREVGLAGRGEGATK